MASNSSARPTCCYVCNKKACQGDCKKCSKRLAGECKELYAIDYVTIGKDIIPKYRHWRCIPKEKK